VAQRSKGKRTIEPIDGFAYFIKIINVEKIPVTILIRLSYWVRNKEQISLAI
jgi:hypothetical protein